MKYTRAQRKTIVKHLKGALAILPDSIICHYKSPYICDCVRRAQNYSGTDMTTKMIAKRINNEFSVERWLKNQSPEIYAEVMYDTIHNDGRKLQTYRKEWLNQLIAEFSA